MKLNLLKMLRVTSRTLSQSKEKVIAIIATGSTVSTVIFAITGQRRADAEIDEINKQLAVNDEEPLTKKEEVEISVKHHLWTAISSGLTIYCIWKGYLNDRDKKAKIIELTGSYALLSKTYDDLQRAIDETGHRDEIKEKVLDNVYQSKKEESLSGEDIYAEKECPHDGLTLFIEEVTGQTFWSTREDVKSVINKINYEMNMSNGYAEQSMDDLLLEFGLRKMGGELGSRIGWDANYTGLIDPKFYRPEPADDHPNANVWVIGYFNPPKENFGKNYGI